MTEHRPVTPFRPTQTSDKHEPTTCSVCGRHATGIGIGSFKSDPKFLCGLCLMILENLKSITEWDRYETAAVAGAGVAAYSYLESIGKTEITSMTEQEWFWFLREVIENFGAELRKSIRSETPF